MEVCMLLIIWCVVGLLLGLFVRRRSVGLALVAAVWAISIATIAARTGYALPLDGDSVGVFATLVVAMLGCLVGALLREHRPLGISPTQGSERALNARLDAVSST
jgi:hypothetical protein